MPTVATLDCARELNIGQRALLQSAAREVLFAGGYGSGKTLALVLKALQLRQINAGVPGLVIAPNWRTMWSIFYRRLMMLLRRWWLPSELPKLVDKTGECFLDFGDGVPMYLRSAKNVDGYDGLDVGWATGDESRYWSRESYNVLQGRIRVPCKMPQLALASTPAMGWLSEEFDSGKLGRQLITASTRENERNLAPGFIENIKASYSRRKWKALIEGIFTILEGAVYEAFDGSPQSPSIVDFTPTHEYLANHKTYLALDPGYRRSAWLWIVERDNLDWVVFDEMMPDGKSDQTCVTEVNRRGWPIDEVWADPAGASVQSFEGASTVMALRQIKRRQAQSGIRMLTGANRQIVFGVDKTRVLLGDEEAGHPIRVRFARRLLAMEHGKQRGIIKDLGAYRYPETKDGRPLSEEPLKDGITDHACLVGTTRVWVDGAGFEKLENLDGLSGRILTPFGIRPMHMLMKTRISASVWRLRYGDGQETIATGDHRFVASARCRCGRVVASFSWLSVLQMRELLQQAEERRPRLPSQGSVGACEWCRPGFDACAPYRRRQDQQRHIEPYADAKKFSPVYALEKDKACRLSCGGAGESESMARIRTGLGMAQRASKARMGGPPAEGVYVHRVWQSLSLEEGFSGEVLPSELQGHCAAQASRHSALARVCEITPAGIADVYCATVPSTGAFITDTGIVSSNCDAFRYWCTGRWLCERKLRDIDPALKSEKSAGWRTAA